MSLFTLLAHLRSHSRPCPCLLTQEALAGFTEAVGTAFGCLVVSGRVVAATESWWRLGTPEAVLLPWLVGSLPPQAARDYPVYLPHGSPTVSWGAGRRGQVGRGAGAPVGGAGLRWGGAELRPALAAPRFRSRTGF